MSILYKHFCTLGTVFLLCFFALASQAQAASALFTVTDVRVDERAENALAAREKAFAHAQKQAFKTLAQRTLSDEQYMDIDEIDPLLLSSLIKDYEVTDEKLSAVRYIGTYTFRFKEAAVRRFFAQRGLSYSDVSSKPVLVLPFYQGEDKMLLWGYENIWMNAWSRMGNKSVGLVPFEVPMGDLQDVRDVADHQAMSYDPERLTAMLARYNAKEAVIAVAVPDYDLMKATAPDDKVSGSLKINLYRTDNVEPQYVQQIAVKPTKGQNRQAFYDMAVQQAQQALQADWKNKTMAHAVQSNMMHVSVAFDSLEQWVKIKKALNRVYGIDRVDVKEMTPQSASVSLYYQGDERRLRLALEQADFTLGQPSITSEVYGMKIQKERVFDLYYQQQPRNVFNPTYGRGGYRQ